MYEEQASDTTLQRRVDKKIDSMLKASAATLISRWNCSLGPPGSGSDLQLETADPTGTAMCQSSILKESPQQVSPSSYVSLMYP